jgi:hypothetical protein
MPLETVGTIQCPECAVTVRVFRRSFTDSRGRPIYAVSLHWLNGRYCPGVGQRVPLSLVTRCEVVQ